MFIDPHVHCRDGKQAYKETVAHALAIAERAGMTAIFDMPNTSPPIDSRNAAVERIALAEKADSPVFYGIYLGITADPAQIREAVAAYNELKNVIGFKMFAGHSVGRMGILPEQEQQLVYRTLAECGYEGVLAVHCEKESLLLPEKWNHAHPITHAYARPPIAETASVQDQVTFARVAGFRGTLHIAHTSVPETVRIVQHEKRKGGLKISCAVTPHHLVFDESAMEGQDGILLKMNPPLRPRGMNTELLEMLRRGMIDWIETDHAPHSLDEKMEPPYLSGIPGIAWWPLFAEYLRQQDFPEQAIERVTFSNIAERFGLDIQRTRRMTKDRRADYPFDPYRQLAAELGQAGPARA